VKIPNKIVKLFTYRFTFMLVPHGAGVPRQVSIHIIVLMLVFTTWTGITFWGSYLSAQHVDYWRTELTNRVLRMKIKFLVNQLDKSRGTMDEVKTAELQLREMLQYKNGLSVIKQDATQSSAGGPTFVDQMILSKRLETTDVETSWDHIIGKVSDFKNTAKERLLNVDDVMNWIDNQRSLLKATPNGWPCPGRVTSHFGKRLSPFNGEDEYHPGVDIAGSPGTPIRATADGVVRYAAWGGGYGNLVVVQHNYGYSTRYAHNSRLMVKIGQHVKRNQILALMGATGKASGPHCHYEVFRYNHRKNPYAYLQNGFRDSEAYSRLSKTIGKEKAS
jgi:murein DD-endopeptidase MepM/ murein hydrolase activator NlpD